MGLNIFQKKLNSSKGIKAFKTNIYGIKTKDSIKCGFFCIGFIDFMINGKSLLECTSFFFSRWLWKELQNNIKIFSIIKKMEKLSCVTCSKYRKFWKHEISYFQRKH